MTSILAMQSCSPKSFSSIQTKNKKVPQAISFQGGNDIFTSSSSKSHLKSEALETSLHLSSVFVDEMHTVLPGAAIAKFLYTAKTHMKATNKSKQDKQMAESFKNYYANPCTETKTGLFKTADKISNERYGFFDMVNAEDVTAEYFLLVLDNFGQALKTIDAFSIPTSSASHDKSEIDKVISTIGTQFPAQALVMNSSQKINMEARSRLIAFDRFDIDKALALSDFELFKKNYYSELLNICFSRYALARDDKDIPTVKYPSGVTQPVVELIAA